MKDMRQSQSWANYLKLINWKVEKIDGVNVFIKKIPVLGNFVKLQRPSILNQKIIDYIKNNYSPFQFSVEPLNSNQIKILKKNKFKISKTPSLPTKTLVINLKKSELDLLKSFSQKTRYNIKLSQNKNIKITESKNILDFTNFWRTNFERQRFPFFSQQKNIIALYNAFTNQNKILLAKRGDKIIATLFLLINNKTTYYLYAASNNEGRKSYAPTLLTWTAILLAKKTGCVTFDFDGIYDSKFPIKSWVGFTKFKSGFSKNEIEYPAMYVKNKL